VSLQVQGRSSSICAHGCKPAIPGILDSERPKQRLLREALEFNRLFHSEKVGLGKDDEARRESEIREALRGYKRKNVNYAPPYTHTFEEIEHGARVAWRNASKCINRPVCMDLKLMDFRHVNTNQDMFDAIVQHLKAAVAEDNVVNAVISVFKPVVPSGLHPTSKAPVAAGPRVWNSQLIRFAGHTVEDGVLGDPSEQEFTAMVKRVFGWRPAALSRFDVLPLVLQIHPDQPPELFELPPEVFLPSFLFSFFPSFLPSFLPLLPSSLPSFLSLLLFYLPSPALLPIRASITPCLSFPFLLLSVSIFLPPSFLPSFTLHNFT
jgi:hypothetical protein